MECAWIATAKGLKVRSLMTLARRLMSFGIIVGASIYFSSNAMQPVRLSL